MTFATNSFSFPFDVRPISRSHHDKPRTAHLSSIPVNVLSAIGNHHHHYCHYYYMTPLPPYNSNKLLPFAHILHFYKPSFCSITQRNSFKVDQTQLCILFEQNAPQNCLYLSLRHYFYWNLLAAIFFFLKTIQMSFENFFTQFI